MFSGIYQLAACVNSCLQALLEVLQLLLNIQPHSVATTGTTAHSLSSLGGVISSVRSTQHRYLLSIGGVRNDLHTAIFVTCVKWSLFSISLTFYKQKMHTVRLARNYDLDLFMIIAHLGVLPCKECCKVKYV